MLFGIKNELHSNIYYSMGDLENVLIEISQSQKERFFSVSFI